MSYKNKNSNTERMILLKYLKISLDTDLKIILLDCQLQDVEAGC